MNTKTIDKFDVMNAEVLMTVEGGRYTGSDCVGAVAGGLTCVGGMIGNKF